MDGWYGWLDGQTEGVVRYGKEPTQRQVSGITPTFEDPGPAVTITEIGCQEDDPQSHRHVLTYSTYTDRQAPRWVASLVNSSSSVSSHANQHCRDFQLDIDTSQ